MAFPIKVCIVCEEEFELKPDKPGFANRCPECSAPESSDSGSKHSMDADERNPRTPLHPQVGRPARAAAAIIT
jgi:hypothetical protein